MPRRLEHLASRAARPDIKLQALRQTGVEGLFCVNIEYIQRENVSGQKQEACYYAVSARPIQLQFKWQQNVTMQIAGFWKLNIPPEVCAVRHAVKKETRLSPSCASFFSNTDNANRTSYKDTINIAKETRNKKKIFSLSQVKLIIKSKHSMSWKFSLSLRHIYTKIILCNIFYLSFFIFQTIFLMCHESFLKK